MRVEGSLAFVDISGFTKLTERLCRAAYDMRATLRTVGTLQTSSGTVTLRMSVGVHSAQFDFYLVGDPDTSGPEVHGLLAAAARTGTGLCGRTSRTSPSRATSTRRSGAMSAAHLPISSRASSLRVGAWWNSSSVPAPDSTARATASCTVQCP